MDLDESIKDGHSPLKPTTVARAANIAIPNQSQDRPPINEVPTSTHQGASTAPALDTSKSYIELSPQITAPCETRDVFKDFSRSLNSIQPESS